jgi:magnesium chelatase subunit D
LLPPTRSVELAKRALDALPAGGGTPLAAGIDLALALARRERSARGRRPLLVVMTDGRANVSLEPAARLSEPRASASGFAIWREIKQIGNALSAEKIPSVVIDTTQRPVSGGDASRLAEVLGGRMVHLPRRGPDSLYETVAAAVESVRRDPGNG